MPSHRWVRQRGSVLTEFARTCKSQNTPEHAINTAGVVSITGTASHWRGRRCRGRNALEPGSLRAVSRTYEDGLALATPRLGLTVPGAAALQLCLVLLRFEIRIGG